MSEILAVCRVHALRADDGMVGVTAIDKRPVAGDVVVRRLGVRGDVQADRADHGGPDQALYAYADESAADWAAVLGRDIPYGLFGENLRTRGVNVDGAEIGERWRLGEDVVVEVTSPRVPCATFARRMGEDRWLTRFAGRGLPGAYLRVLATGTVRAGDAVEVVGRPGHGVRVSDWFVHHRPADARALLDADRAGTVGLAGSLRAHAELVATRRG